KTFEYSPSCCCLRWLLYFKVTQNTPSKDPKAHAQCSRTRKRALRSGAAPLQAHDRKNRPVDRAARPRVLREADRRAQAQARGGGQAALQAPAQSTTSAEAVLAVSASRCAWRPAALNAVLRAG